MSENPTCPLCGGMMKLRTARKGPNAGSDFWGCAHYPECKGTRPLDPEEQDVPVFNLLELFIESAWPNPAGFSDADRFFVPCGASRTPEGNPLFRSWNHLCISTPKGLQPAPLQPAVLTALHSVRRIMGRGMAPPLPVFFRDKLPSVIKEIFQMPRSKPAFGQSNSDDPSVRMFRQFIPERLRPDLLPFTFINFSSAMLLGPNGSSSPVTCDFVFFHPARETKAIIVKLVGGAGKKHQDEPLVLEELKNSCEKAGHKLYLVDVEEIKTGSGPVLDDVFRTVSSYPALPQWDPHPAAAAHTLIALVESIELGILSPGAAEWELVPVGPYRESMIVGIQAFQELAKAAGELYGIGLAPEKLRILGDKDRTEGRDSLRFEWTDREPWFAPVHSHPEGELPFISLHPIWLPAVSSLPPPPTTWTSPNVSISRENLKTLLRFTFPGKDDFWEGQEEGIRRCLAGNDSLVLLPTGGGKSLIYQLSALLMPGFSLIVDPLISLMEDQVDNLMRAGIDRAVNISSTTTKMGKSDDTRSLLKTGVFTLCFISPERLQIKSFRDDLVAISLQMPIPLVVIDEAHCVSEWGHDFRPAYLNLARNARKIGRRGHGQPPSLVGLTGTASRAVLRDLQNELGIADLSAVITPTSFDRRELSFEVVHQPSLQKSAALEGILRGLPAKIRVRPGDFFISRGKDTSCGIVFCPHVKGYYGVRDVAAVLENRFNISVPNYSGELETVSRSRTAQRFKENETPLLVATKAFGMGIDKPNIRYTVHYGLPPSLEAFYQEAGRAGRDKKPAHCTLIVSVENELQAEKLLDPSNDIETLQEIYKSIPRDRKDDIVRILYFHTEAFQGVEKELEAVENVIRLFGPMEEPGKEIISFNENDGSKLIEKSLHRLILLGIIADYTVNYTRKIVEVERRAITAAEMLETARRYVASYSRSRADRLLGALEYTDETDARQSAGELLRLLLGFIYETVEASRRAAIREVWRWSLLENSDEVLRRRLVDYLQETEFSRDVLDILRESEHDLVRWHNLLEKVSSLRDLQELDSGLSRATEDFPDHPAILAMRAVVAGIRENPSEASSFAVGCMQFLRRRYTNDPHLMLEYAGWLLEHMPDSDGLRPHVLFKISENDDGTICTLAYEKYSSHESRLGAVPRLMSLLTDKVNAGLNILHH